MPEKRRLHTAAIAVYSADAQRNAAFPLLIIIVMPLLGGSFDSRGLLRAAIYGAIGLVIAVAAGYARWTSTTYWIDDAAIHHHTGVLRERDTKVPLERVEALDVHQGPLQRTFGVIAVDVQTGAAKKGGEIALPALTPGGGGAPRPRPPGAGGGRRGAVRRGGGALTGAPPPGPPRRLPGRELAVAAL